MELLEAPLAIVDLETTGGHPARDRVTEIAVLEIERGEIAAEWATLVNPERPIPAPIQALTGITDAMVARAPRFGALAAGLHERLAGRVFVAHNARFDYGFLRHEFARSGIDFEARTLCTVRLSRRLYPGHARHDLDSLIERHGLRCDARHRALGDARAVWEFLRVAGEQYGAEVLAVAARELARLPALPPGLARESVDAIPEAPGVYLFFGERGAPLYVGKSVTMRSRVLAHFAAGLRSARAAQLAREVRDVDWQRTCGALGALLREAELVKALEPPYNRRLRRAAALARRPRVAWPWRGPIGVVERDDWRDATEVHVIHDWCWLGAARSEDEIARLLEAAARPRFDLDQYRILARHLTTLRAHIVELPHPEPRCIAS